MRLTHFSLIPLAVSVASCATGPSPLTQRLASIPDSEHAYIIGTYVVTCRVAGTNCFQSFNSLSTYFRSTETKEVRGTLNSVFGGMFTKDTAFDFINQAEAEKGFHFCIALPPGAYEFYSYDFYNFAGGGSGFSIPEKNQFSIRFSVSPGEVLNVGTLKLSTTTGQNIFGMSLPAPGVLLISPDPAASNSTLLLKCPESVRTRPVRKTDLSASITMSSPLVQTLPAR